MDILFGSNIDLVLCGSAFFVLGKGGAKCKAALCFGLFLWWVSA